MTEPAPKPHSPEPWVQDHHDRKTVLDAFSRLVAVTTSREDAARIVAGVNASRGLAADGLDASPLSDALQVLFEICLYQTDVRFRNHVDRRGGFESLVTRADKAWRAFGEDAFQNPIRKEGEKDAETVSEPQVEKPPEKPVAVARRTTAASAGATAVGAGAGPGAAPVPVAAAAAPSPERAEAKAQPPARATAPPSTSKAPPPGPKTPPAAAKKPPEK